MPPLGEVFGTPRLSPYCSLGSLETWQAREEGTRAPASLWTSHECTPMPWSLTVTMPAQKLPEGLVCLQLGSTKNNMSQDALFPVHLSLWTVLFFFPMADLGQPDLESIPRVPSFESRLVTGCVLCHDKPLASFHPNPTQS